MYFSISPVNLSGRLDAMKKFVDDIKTAPVFITANTIAKKIILQAGGRSASCTFETDAEVSVDGSVFVNMEMLLLLIRTYSGGKVFIRIGNNGRLQIAAEPTFPVNRTVSLAVLPPTTVISVFVPSMTLSTLKLKADELRYGVDHVKALAKIDSNNVLTTAINVKYTPTLVEFAMMSQRGFTIIGIESECSNSGSVLIPQEVISKLPESAIEDIEILDCGNTVVFQAGDWKVVSCVYSGQFANYDSVLATTPTSKLSIITKDILPMLRRADLLTDSGAGRTIIFDVVGKELKLSLNGKMGDYNDFISCRSENIASPVGFYIEDLLPAIVAVAADSTELGWIGNAVTVKAEVADKIKVTCLVKTVQVSMVSTPVSVPIVVTEDIPEPGSSEITNEDGFIPPEGGIANGGEITVEQTETPSEEEVHIITEDEPIGV